LWGKYFQDEVQRRLSLNVVICKGAAVLQHFTGKDQTLLVSRNSLFILKFGFNIFDRVSRFDFERDGLARQCFFTKICIAIASSGNISIRLSAA
jgi:hypothetical protein